MPSRPASSGGEAPNGGANGFLLDTVLAYSSTILLFLLLFLQPLMFVLRAIFLGSPNMAKRSYLFDADWLGEVGRFVGTAARIC